jgi:hypothetical protein
MMSGKKIIDGLNDAIEGRGTTPVVHVQADIVDRLRKHPTRISGFRDVMDDAANEIERLRKVLGKKAIPPLVYDPAHPDGPSITER